MKIWVFVKLFKALYYVIFLIKMLAFLRSSLIKPWLVFAPFGLSKRSLPVHTFLSRVDGGNRSKRTLPLVVVNANLYMERRERLDALVFKDVSGRLWGRHGGLHPARGPMRPERHHVAEPRPILQLLWNRLQANTQQPIWTSALNTANKLSLCSLCMICK